jgi:hypothetical protein
MNMPGYQGNIERTEAIDLGANGNYEDENGFFIRVGTAGNVKYCTKLNGDDTAETKNFDASTIFVDPEICRKIFASGTTASGIVVGFGV